MTAAAVNTADALSRGESVPGGPGACFTCGHLTLWHGVNGRYRGKPCQRCDCRAFSATADDPAPEPSRPRRRPARKIAAPPPGQLALFPADEVV
jgi:hypothetical protein